jgi:hypothetical protein
MAESGKSDVPGKLENWGTQTKNARPSSVGQHDPIQDPGNPSGPGIKPEQGYKPGPGTQEGKAGPGTPGKAPVMHGVKPADEIKPGQKRDAPPLSGLPEE